MNIAENLELLATTKENIRVAINNRGGSLEISTPFSAYPEAISSVGANDLIDLIEGDAVTFDIPSGTTAIAPYKFYAMNSLTAVTIPNSVTSIGNYAFHACDQLNSVVIPTSVRTIGDGSFGSCYSLGDLTIPDSVTSIGSNAFNGCENIVNLTIGSSVTSIGASAFNGCFGLTSVTIPASVSTIGSNAFNACRWLESITCLAATPPTLGANAFYNTNNCPIYVPAASVEAYKTAWSDYTSRIESIPVPTVNSALYDIDGNLIDECDVDELNLSSFEGILPIPGYPDIYKLVVGSSVTAITDNPDFSSCSNLTVLDFSNASSLQSIGESAFSGCTYLENVDIPNSVTSIGNYAFGSCSGMTGSLIIPDSVTSIGTSAFLSCEGLTSVTIGNSVTSISGSAFRNCIGLESITCLATTPPTLTNNAFNDTNNCPIYVPAASVETYKAASGWTNFASRIEAIQP